MTRALALADAAAAVVTGRGERDRAHDGPGVRADTASGWV